MLRKIVGSLAMLLAVNGAAAAPSGNVNFLLGTKTLDTNDWAPFEDQAAFGVLVDFKGDTWPISMAIDILGSYDEQTILGLKTEASTSEFDIGVARSGRSRGVRSGLLSAAASRLSGEKSKLRTS